MKCSWPNCDHDHKNGYRLLRHGPGWRCVEHAPAEVARRYSPDRPLTEREARTDAGIPDSMP